jgi:hypothetical protein
MAKKATKAKSTTKKTGESKPRQVDQRPPGLPKKTADRLAGARRIGTREETIQEILSPGAIEGERAKVCDLIREVGRVKDAHKTATAAAKAKIQDLEEQKEAALRNASTGRRDIEITVEEWLDKSNQVLRVRKDSGEIIGDRTARVDELQESLFEEADEADNDDDSEDEGGKADDDGNGEGTPDPAGDFGGGGQE